jgi:hypothetical protein
MFIMKPIVLYLKYSDRAPWKLWKLKKILKSIFTINPFIVIIDNKSAGRQYELLDRDTAIIGGDNSDWEFSGWQKALHLLEEKIRGNYDPIVFVNDSFMNYGGCFLEERTYAELEESHKSGALTGVVDKSDLDMRVSGYDVGSWIRSNAFIMPVDLAYSVQPLNHINEGNIDLYIGRECGGEYFAKNADVSKDLREHMIQWLEKHWHKRFSIKSNRGLFRQKAKAMLNEKIMTAKVRSLKRPICGYSPVDGSSIAVIRRILRKGLLPAPILRQKCHRREISGLACTQKNRRRKNSNE